MPDRDERPDKSATGKKAPTHGDERAVPQDPDLAQQPDPESQESTTARPRGHTEEPDRTL
jgi:hypothetical protein